jgi:hypothetical protein
MSVLKAGRPSRKEKALAEVQGSRDEMIRMNINMPKIFYKKIKQKALDEDITITDLVIKATKEYISK